MAMRLTKTAKPKNTYFHERMTQHTDNQPTIYRVRPRFQVETSEAPGDFLSKIKKGLGTQGATCHGKVYPTYAILSLPFEERHYWSPQLHISVEETEDGSLVRGLYGPRPIVWTMFVFFYAMIGFAALIVSIVGLSHLTLDQPANILWFVPGLVLLFLSLYLVAYFGKRRGHDQMETLHRFVEKTTGLAFEDET